MTSSEEDSKEEQKDENYEFTEIMVLEEGHKDEKL